MHASHPPQRPGFRVGGWRQWALGWLCAMAIAPAWGQQTVASGPAAARAPLVFFGDRDHAPYEFLEDGEPRGASVELIQALGRQMGRGVEIRLLDWTQAQARLQAGEGDALTMLARNPERELRYSFSRAALPMSLSLVVRVRDVQQFNAENLTGRRIGVTAAGAPRLVLARQHPEATLVVIDTLEAGLQALLREEIDAVGGITWAQLHLINRLGLRGVAALPPLQLLQPSIAVRRGETALLAEIDVALAELERSGEVGRIIDRWSGQRIYTFTSYTVRMGQIAGVVAALALLALGVAVIFLRRQRATLAREVAMRQRAEAAAEQRAGEARILQRMATALAGAMTPDEVGAILQRLVADLPSQPQVWLAKPWRNKPGWRMLTFGAGHAEPAGAGAAAAAVAPAADPPALLAAFDRAAGAKREAAFTDRAGLRALLEFDSAAGEALAGVDGGWFFFSLLQPAAPLPDGRPLGAMLLAWPEPPAGFDAAEAAPARALLEGVVALVAQALERAQAQRAEQRAAAQQAALRMAASAFAIATGTEMVCRVAADVVRESLGAAYATLGLFEHPPVPGDMPAPDQVLRLVTDEKMPAALKAQFPHFPASAGVPMSLAACSGETLYFEDRAALDAATPELAHWPNAAHVQALAALPLHAPGTTDASLNGVSSRLGAMTVHFELAHRFDVQERDFLETLAPMAARAIERCQLLERLQQSLARSEEEGLRSRLATQAAGMGSWDIELASELMHCNARMYELFGLPGGEGREPVARFFAPVHTDDRVALADSLRQAQADGSDFEHSFRVVLKGDAVRWLLSRGRTLGGLRDKPLRMLGHTLDITPLVQARLALETADRHKDEFLATVSHELRNPLGPILNAATMLARAGERAEVRSMAVPLIQRQIKQMTHLIDDLLELSRIRHRRIVLQRAPVDALQAVNDALEAVRPALDKAGHQLEVRPAAKAVLVDADAPRLTQMLCNLLNNACKYSPDGGLIEVDIERAGGQGVIRVSDNGVGIAPEVLPRIFELFVQDRHDRERAGGGLGLGLALVKRLVELHGGSVEVASAGRGHGASFTLRLPLARVNPADGS